MLRPAISRVFLCHMVTFSTLNLAAGFIGEGPLSNTDCLKSGGTFNKNYVIFVYIYMIILIA